MTTTEVRAEVTTRTWRGDLYDKAMRDGSGPLFLRRGDGWMLPLDVERWCGHPRDADLEVLRRCHGSVLDIGCGPGRFVTTLCGRGFSALGIDLHPTAVDRVQATGGQARCLSVFEPVPREGHWDTALLMDGNIGIGGDPVTLLDRVAEVMGVKGRVIAEVTPFDVDERVSVRVDDGMGHRGAAFPWARVGSAALARLAPVSGWDFQSAWTSHGREFVTLTRR